MTRSVRDRATCLAARWTVGAPTDFKMAAAVAEVRRGRVSIHPYQIFA